MDETGRKEPQLGDNPYANPGTERAAINAAPAPAAATTGEHRYPVAFTASAGEYFRIWIVNLALTILTLGIYSAWAKVRKKRYFYGHTRVDDDGFEYRGNPVAILKGRIIAVVLLATYSFAGHFSPGLKIVFAIVLAFAVPWLIVRSLAFNAYNSAYRNIRLHFRGTYGECLKVMVLYGLLTVISLGLGYPYLKARLVRFAAGNHHYGTTQFEIGSLTRAFYRVYLKAIGVMVLGFIVLGIAVGVAVFALGAGIGGRGAFSSGARILFIVAAYGGYLLLFAYLRARITNLTINAITIGPVQFESTLRARDLAGLYLVNIIAIIVTLGLATPWAVVRTLRYRAGKTTVLVARGLDSFVAGETRQVAATGEAVGEMFDFDIGL
jgi:uncharacterized membrane protein YjgN (DUF898 family)